MNGGRRRDFRVCGRSRLVSDKSFSATAIQEDGNFLITAVNPDAFSAEEKQAAGIEEKETTGLSGADLTEIILKTDENLTSESSYDLGLCQTP